MVALAVDRSPERDGVEFFNLGRNDHIRLKFVYIVDLRQPTILPTKKKRESLLQAQPSVGCAVLAREICSSTGGRLTGFP